MKGRLTCTLLGEVLAQLVNCNRFAVIELHFRLHHGINGCILRFGGMILKFLDCVILAGRRNIIEVRFQAMGLCCGCCCGCCLGLVTSLM